MSTLKLGLLKVKTSEDGIAFRFGEGKVHRFGMGKKAQPAVEGAYNDAAYDEDRFEDESFDAAASGYSGRFAQYDDGSDYDDGYDDDYGDDGYDDNGYDDDGYYDDGDGYADDGYDDGYGDDEGYYGDDGYEDRYSDEDAGDYDGYEEEGSLHPVLRFVDENDWVTYVLLFLLPPLGIFLLWRRRRFEETVRWVVSAVSGLWFVIALIMIISAILSGPGDATRNPPIAITTPTPTAPTDAATSPEATDSLLDDVLNSGVGTLGNSVDGIEPAQTVDALAPDATATPLPGYSAPENTASGYVLMTTSDVYYHSNASCPNLDSTAMTSNVDRNVAVQRGKSPCPICYPGQDIYYATANGTYYHTDQYCTNMKNAIGVTKDVAEEYGKKPCPVCVEHSVNTLEKTGLKYATASTTDQSGITVYATQNGTYFHTNSTCTNMRNATALSLLQAKLAGKKACPTCAADADTLFWFTANGKMYHNKSNCSNMVGANEATLAEALILGKTRCPTCLGNTTAAFGNNAGSGSGSSTVYVYGTANGKYYHTDPTCTNMKNAQRIPLATMLQAGREACPTCAASANTTVYATKGGTYYHSYATCSGMTNASAGTIAQAMAAGLQKCPHCWSGGKTTTTNTGTGNSSGTMVYATQNGTYYHTNSSCSGMKNAVRVDLSVAVKYGKTACPTCAAAATRLVYSTEGGKYYHVKSDCSNMKNAKQRTLQDALILGQSSCPVCIGSAAATNTQTTTTQQQNTTQQNTAQNNTANEQLQPGTSGVKVYSTASDQYYHGYVQHAGSNAIQVSLETAMNYGKTACPTCIKVATTTVYAVKGGRYYHASKTCAGTGAVAGRLDAALAYGMDACPVCVTRTQTVSNSNTFKSGTSGVNVWATLSGPYFHTKQSCAGAGAYQITLEVALNYGKTPCPSCAASAAKTVYANGKDGYYHSSREHAGTNAQSGYWAFALAMGMKACPVCIGGSEALEVSDIQYSAPADTLVYIDTSSTLFYYHRTSRCADAGFSGGTGVTLDFTVNWGFKACPYCNPPTAVS